MTETLQIAADRVGQWRLEHASINHSIREARRWLAAVSPQKSDCHENLGTLLKTLDSQLRAHFRLAIEIYDAMAEELWCIEVESAKQIAIADQQHLLHRLDSLICCLLDVPSAYSSLNDAADELEWIFDELDQHEERESDSFEWLLLSHCG
ncbi:MAG: hypothetical protein ACO1RT_17750 [Planctomycetaceae bacterium]